MRQKWLLYCLTFAMLLSCIISSTIFADEQPITVYVNGQALEFDVKPVTEDDRTLVPMRAIFEALGAEVDWNEQTETVIAVKGELTIELTIHTNSMVKDGKEIPLDVPARLIDSRTMVPIRAISEGLGAQVEWREETRTVTITTASAVSSPSALPSPTPTSPPIAKLDGIDHTNVAMGVLHTLILKHDGSIWAKGKNRNGQLGFKRSFDTSDTIDEFVQVAGIENPVGVYSTEYTSFALTAEGHVYSWGYNGNGMLGCGKKQIELDSRYQPEKLEGLDHVIKLACGKEFVLALKSDGTVWGWGINRSFEMGQEEKESYAYHSPGMKAEINYVQPVQIPSLSDIRDIAAGESYALAAKKDGTVLGWGEGTLAPPRVPGARNVPEPQYANSSQYGRLLTHITALAAGKRHAAAITDKGSVYTWGNGIYGQLGNARQGSSDGHEVQIPLITNGTILSYNLPSTKDAKPLNNIKKVVANEHYSAALDADGKVYYWGESPFLVKPKRFGSTTIEEKVHGLSVHEIPGLTNAVDIYIGWQKIDDYKEKYIDNKREDIDYITPDVNQLIIVKADGTVWSIGTSEKQIFDLN